MIPAVEIPTRTLVLGMAHRDGTIVASEVYPVAEACGLTSDQVRSCIRRLVSEDLFTREGEGRHARLSATTAGLRRLHSSNSRARLAYTQDAAGRGWDRMWHLVGFVIPESNRSARDALRDRLVANGGAAIQSGLYVCAHPWEAVVREDAAELGVADLITTASTDDLEIGGERDPRRLASRLWDLATVAEGYRRFVDLYAGVPEALEAMRQQRERLEEADFLPGALLIGLEFNKCFEADPLLPPELVPRPWPGREARDLLLRSRRLGMRIRAQHDRPALFHHLDELFETV